MKEYRSRQREPSSSSVIVERALRRTKVAYNQNLNDNYLLKWKQKTDCVGGGKNGPIVISKGK